MSFSIPPSPPQADSFEVSKYSEIVFVIITLHQQLNLHTGFSTTPRSWEMQDETML